MLPTFLVIGAHKAGTTTLSEHLRRHPDVFIAADKEVHYFSQHNWDRGRDWYEALFDAAGSARAVGEASPGYTCYPMFDNVPERAAQLLPDAKLVYVIRQPIDRLVSHYRQDAVFWGETRPIDEALLDWRMYVSRSMYALQIERWLANGYGREQLLVITTDELQSRPAETMATVFGFLDVDPAFTPPTLGAVFNQGARLRTPKGATEAFRQSAAYRQLRRVVPQRLRQRAWELASTPVSDELATATISPATRTALVGQLRPDLVKLRDYLGADFGCWGLLEERVG